MVFENSNRKYVIEFSHLGILQIIGKSGSGKSLLCQDLKAAMADNREIKDNCVVIDYERIQIYKQGLTLTLLEGLSKEYNTFFIDNADILIVGKSLEQYIWRSVISANKKWVLIGRRIFSCVPIGCRGILSEKKADEKKLVTIDYDENSEWY